MLSAASGKPLARGDSNNPCGFSAVARPQHRVSALARVLLAMLRFAVGMSDALTIAQAVDSERNRREGVRDEHSPQA